METRFDRAFPHLMDNEGIESNDPVDVGGKTILGCASKYWSAWFGLIYAAYKSRGIDAAKKIAKRFYKVEFWNDRYAFIEDSSLAFRIFDFGVNAGVKKSVKIFQRSVNYLSRRKIKVDGDFGNKTLVVCNSIIPQERLYLLYTIRIYLFYMVRPTKWKHLRGWTLRLLKRYWLDEKNTN